MLCALVVALVAAPLIRSLSIGHLSTSSRRTRRFGTVSTDADDIPYNWKNQWYALCFMDNLQPKGSAQPTAASVFGYPLVLWRDDKEQIHCVEDRCPHRSAKLSEGRIRDGLLECYYHGWQFKGGTGDCVTIPQLPAGAKIPAMSCTTPYPVEVHEDIIWVHMDPKTPKDKRPPIPSTHNQELATDLKLPPKKRKFTTYDFQIDLPYDHSYLVENLIDPAHVPISHDRNGAKREDAQAYEMIVSEDVYVCMCVCVYVYVYVYVTPVCVYLIPDP